MPAHARRTSARDAAASAVSVGKRFMNRGNASVTLLAWVCCSITSETQTAYGSSSVRRHG